MSAINCFPQESSLYVTDSLLKGNKVKTRILFYTNPLSQYVTEDYTKDGRKSRSYSRDKNLATLITSTNYYYDEEGKIYASLTRVPDGPLKKIILKTKFYLSGDSVVTHYQYNLNNKLIRQYANDSTNNLFFECTYKYNPFITTQKWFDKSGNIEFQITTTFENEKFIIKKVSVQYSENKIVNTNTETFNNTYDLKGRLIKIDYSSDKSNTQAKFKYNKNGLLKSKSKDQCLTNWEYEYEYY